MTSSLSRTPSPDLRLLTGQVAGAWGCGSVFLGTVALVFVISRGPILRLTGLGATPLVVCPQPIVGGGCSSLSLFQLTPAERLAVIALVAMVFVSLAVLVWRTAAATWLAGDTRARLLWVVVVGMGGFAGWSFAAVVTFAAGFSPLTQLILGYSCGGLPFGLVAGMLLRPWRANVAALGISAALVAAGFLMVAGQPPPYPRNVFTLYADYARFFFSRSGNATFY